MLVCANIKRSATIAEYLRFRIFSGWIEDLMALIGSLYEIILPILKF